MQGIIYAEHAFSKHWPVPGRTADELKMNVN
jgi:hypothetical protein